MIDVANYKDYILVMLFFKYISDVWIPRSKKYKEKYKNEPSRIEQQLELEQF
nr:type I restriction-modification system subunit M N-terminal domain-containing protein [Rickettsia australis]